MKLGLSVVKPLAHGHTAMWKSQDLNLGLSCSKTHILSVSHLPGGRFPGRGQIVTLSLLSGGEVASPDSPQRQVETAYALRGHIAFPGFERLSLARCKSEPRVPNF